MKLTREQVEKKEDYYLTFPSETVKTDIKLLIMTVKTLYAELEKAEAELAELKERVAWYFELTEFYKWLYFLDAHSLRHFNHKWATVTLGSKSRPRKTEEYFELEVCLYEITKQAECSLREAIEEG